MILNIPSRSIINEYRTLKNSQKEVSINSTSKQLDEYVYDKSHKFNNAKIAGILTLLDITFCLFARKDKAVRDCTFMFSIANFAGLGLMFDNNSNKKFVLKHQKEKLQLYKKSGINAVI